MEKLKYIIPILVIAILILTLFSCKDKMKRNTDSKIIYRDIKMLGNILNLSVYKPDSTLFKYAPLLSSIEGRQPSLLPGPKDYVLEAVLYFKPETMQKLKNKLETEAPYPKDEESMRQIFSFNWLPDAIKKEIQQIDTLREYPATAFFNTGTSQMILLKDKIILYALTN